jgi:hypothetical protein
MAIFALHPLTYTPHADDWRARLNRAEAVGSVVALLLVAGTAVLAANVATLTITGHVALNMSIAVTPTPVASQLDLSINQPPIAVAAANVVSNNVNGYAVTVASANVLGGRCSTPCLATSGGGTASLPFSLFRDSAPISFAAGSGTFVTTTSRSPAGGDTYVVRLSYDGSSANLPANSSYNEVLTFTLSVN